MAAEAALIAFGSVVAVLLLWRVRCRRVAVQLPLELRAAWLIYTERLFQSGGQVSITAKVDRVYRNAAGELVLVELKTRRTACVFPSDLIELSAQRVALAAQTKEAVAEHAYVCTETPEGRGSGWHRVELMRTEQVRAVALRRESLLTGGAAARNTPWQENCRLCPFQRKCKSSNELVAPTNVGGDAE